MKVGSLFSGYDGLGMGLELAGVPVERQWFSDNESGPATVLRHHWPNVPNLGDITQIKWKRRHRVEMVTGGFPCQDLSTQGKGAGLTHGKRSGLWLYMFRAIKKLKPAYVLAENVEGLLSAKADSEVEPCSGCVGDTETFNVRALGAVLADLAGIGYDARWCRVRASGVGAPHQRSRIVVLAWKRSLADPTSEQWITPAVPVDAPLGAGQLGDESVEDSPFEWRQYKKPVKRWRKIMGRRPSWPFVQGSQGGVSQSPEFVEWMMGLPKGFVTAVPGLSSTQMSTMLGNGCMPQQIAAAVLHLIDRESLNALI